jgi:hypothetical protein
MDEHPQHNPGEPEFGDHSDDAPHNPGEPRFDDIDEPAELDENEDGTDAAA